MDNDLSSVKILGTKVTTSSKAEILEYILGNIKNGDKKMYIVTPNPEILMLARRSKSFQNILNQAQVALPDGIGVVVSGKILKKGIKGRIPGVDFMEELCYEASKQALTVGFLGGRGNVAEITAKRLSKKYPGLIVGFVGEEWSANSGLENRDSVVASSLSVNRSLHQIIIKSNKKNIEHQISNINPHLDFLFVAFGFPKQEEWIYKNLPKIDVSVAMGVGGAFDFISGKVPRAPKFIRRVGMEWAYRLVKEPRRFKRQLALPVFALEVLKEKMK